MFTRICKLTVLLAAVAAFNTARAEETPSTDSNGSEFLYQTEGGKFQVTPHIIMGTAVTKYNDTNTGIKNLKGTTGYLPIGAQVEYGINEMISVDLDLAYQGSHTSFSCDSTTCPQSSTAKGLNDPSFDIKLRNKMGPGTLRYGANLSLSIEKSKVDSSGNSNAASGGSTVTPFVAYELPLGPGFIGGRATYDVYKADRKQTDDRSTPSDSTITGGQQLNLTAFYEANVGIMTYGGALTYTSGAESKSAASGASSVGNKDAQSDIAVQFYVPAHFTPNITLLPVAGFSANNYTSSGASADASVLLYIGVGGRFTF